jgi:hypothetical protein
MTPAAVEAASDAGKSVAQGSTPVSAPRAATHAAQPSGSGVNSSSSSSSFSFSLLLLPPPSRVARVLVDDDEEDEWESSSGGQLCCLDSLKG